MDDVVGEVVVAAADENLGPRDAVASVVVAVGLGDYLAQVRAAARFSQAHGARGFAAHHLRQPRVLEFFGPVHQNGVDGALAEPGKHEEGPVGRRNHFRLNQSQRHGQALAAVLFGEAEPLPAGFFVQLVGMLGALGRDHLAVHKLATLAVGSHVQRRQLAFAQIRRGFHHHIL